MPPARYDVYRWEIDNAQIPNKSAAGGENGNPACSSAAVSDEPDRRIIYAAVINCIEHDLRGGSGDTIPALTFMKMEINIIERETSVVMNADMLDVEDGLVGFVVDIWVHNF